MSSSRFHRSRFFVYGLAIGLLVVTLYVYQAKQEQIESLHKCRAEQVALSVQLRSVIEYKERMEHTLAAERSQHAETINALHSRQEEQIKLTKIHMTVQNSYNNLSQECKKIKSVAKTDHEFLESCKTQNSALVANNEDLQKRYDDYITEVSGLKVLTAELVKKNRELVEKIQMQSHPVNVPRSGKFVAQDDTKYVTKQVKIAEDVYNMSILTASQNRDVLQEDKSSQIHLPNLYTNETKVAKPTDVNELPLGVAPELFVDDRLKERIGQSDNKKDKSRVEDSLNKPQVAGDAPNRYNTKLGENAEKSDKNSMGDAFIPVDSLPEDLVAKDDDNHVHQKVEENDKKDINNDINLSQNNQEQVEHDDNREDDDTDDYGYHRVEGGEEPVN